MKKPTIDSIDRVVGEAMCLSEISKNDVPGADLYKLSWDSEEGAPEKGEAQKVLVLTSKQAKALSEVAAWDDNSNGYFIGSQAMVDIALIACPEELIEDRGGYRHVTLLARIAKYEPCSRKKDSTGGSGAGRPSMLVLYL
jgi:hypothetical protein